MPPPRAAISRDVKKLSEAVVSLAGFTLSPIHLDAIDRANGPAIVSQFMTTIF